MINSAAETAQSAAAAATNSGTNEAAVDAELFTRELSSKLEETDTEAARRKVAQTMEKLTSSLPGVTVGNRSLSSFAELGRYYVETGSNATVNITAGAMAQMADNEELFNGIKDMIAGLLEAGKNQNLATVGGASSTTGNVNVTETEIRYVEVQRGSQGTTLSVSSLSLEFERLQAEAVQTLLDLFADNGSAGSNNDTFDQFEFLSQTRGRDQGWSFNDVVSSTSSWRLEAVLNNPAVANQVLGAQQSFSASLEIFISQLSAGGGSASGSDLLAYIQIMGLSDPLVFDLGDEGINLTSVEDGVYFDIKGDGSPVQTAFIKGNNAFLYLDGNGNGVVDDVSELFGDYGGYANGFESLRRYDDNGDGVIDENDAVYDQLRLWRDLNGDGVNQVGESIGFAEAGIRSVDLGYDEEYELDGYGNVIGETSGFTRVDGSRGLVADVWLRNR